MSEFGHSTYGRITHPSTVAIQVTVADSVPLLAYAQDRQEFYLGMTKDGATEEYRVTAAALTKYWEEFAGAVRSFINDTDKRA